MGDAYFTQNGQLEFSRLFLVPSSVAFAAALFLFLFLPTPPVAAPVKGVRLCDRAVALGRTESESPPGFRGVADTVRQRDAG